MAMLNSKIIIVSGATIWVIFQNSVSYVNVNVNVNVNMYFEAVLIIVGSLSD